MAASLHRCPQCRRYTLEVACPADHASTILPRPPKFSLIDKYGQYRREAKRKEWQEQDLY